MGPSDAGTRHLVDGSGVRGRGSHGWEVQDGSRMGPGWVPPKYPKCMKHRNYMLNPWIWGIGDVSYDVRHHSATGSCNDIKRIKKVPKYRSTLFRHEPIQDLSGGGTQNGSSGGPKEVPKWSRMV